MGCGESKEKAVEI